MESNSVTLNAPTGAGGGAGASTTEIPIQPPSKKSLKKAARKAKFLQSKAERRKHQRLKKKQLTQKRVAAGIKLPFSRDYLKSKKMCQSSCQVGIVIDLSFDSLMIEKDVHKTVKQVSRCYSINRRQPNPLQFHVTSFDSHSPESQSSCSKIMEKHDGFTNWDVNFHPESYEQLFDKDKLVYLSSDSRNVLEEIEEGKLYVIGGLVDHNSRKGLCKQLAEAKGIKTARLPVEKYVDIKTVKVFSIVHVFEILANVCQGISWEDAFIKVIPQRKNAELLKSEDNNTKDAAGADGDDSESDSSESASVSENISKDL